MYVFNPTKDDDEERRRSRDERNERGESPRGSDVGLTGQEGSSGT